MKVKITTDGTPLGTKIIDTETGEHLENRCTALHVFIRPEDISVEVTLLVAKNDIVFDGDFEVFKTIESDERRR